MTGRQSSGGSLCAGSSEKSREVDPRIPHAALAALARERERNVRICAADPSEASLAATRCPEAHCRGVLSVSPHMLELVALAPATPATDGREERGELGGLDGRLDAREAGREPDGVLEAAATGSLVRVRREIAISAYLAISRSPPLPAASSAVSCGRCSTAPFV